MQHTLVRDLRNTQSVAGAQLTGELFTLPAGPAQLASGFEYRKETLSMRDDGLAVMGLIDQALGAQPVDAEFDVKEAYAELVVPVAADLPLLHKASLEGAARYSSYDTIGDTTTWKLGGVWAPFRDLRFRVMRAYSVRAPNLYELFSPGVFGFGTNYDPCSAENIDLGSATGSRTAGQRVLPEGWLTPRPGLGATARTGGNPNLDPGDVQIMDDRCRVHSELGATVLRVGRLLENRNRESHRYDGLGHHCYALLRLGDARQSILPQYHTWHVAEPVGDFADRRNADQCRASLERWRGSRRRLVVRRCERERALAGTH